MKRSHFLAQFYLVFHVHCTVDILVFLTTLRTTVLAVRNTPLTNIPKGFSSKMTLEVA